MRRFIALPLVVAAALMIGCAGRGDKTNQSGSDDRGVPVAVAPVERATMVQAVPVTGTLKALREAAVTAQVSARVVEVRVREGDTVSKGQVLATLDRTELTTQADQNRAAVEAAEAHLQAARKRLQVLEMGARSEEREIARSRLEQAEAALRQAEADLARMRRLFDQGGIAKQQLDGAQTAYDTARTNRDAARQTLELTEKGPRPEEIEAARQEVKAAAAGLEQAGAALARAQEMLGYTVIRSPLSGVVYERHIEPGEIVSTMGGPPLLRIADLSSVYYEATVPERLAPQVHAGQRAQVMVHWDGERAFQGKVELLVPVADPESRNFLARVAIEKAAGITMPGVYASGSIVVQERADALTVPKDAIVERSGRSLVFVITGDKAEEREVKIGLTERTRAEILSGVQAGERVVVEGAQGMKNGDQVLVQKAEGD